MVACGAHYITLQSPKIRNLSDGKRGCRFSFSARRRDVCDAKVQFVLFGSHVEKSTRVTCCSRRNLDITLLLLLLLLLLFHRPIAEANAKEGALASHGKRRKKKKKE